MKQKLLNSTLYVFDVDPYIITEDASEATVIKVQEESYKGFVEMNPDLVNKLTKYNYHVICVNTPEWAPYVDDEDPQEQLTFGIYGSATEASILQVQRQDANNNILETWVAGQNLNFPFQASFNEGEHFTVEFVNGVCPDVLNITGDALSIQWQDAETNNFWRATPALSTSTSVGIDAAEPSNYLLSLTGSDINDTNLRVDVDHNTISLETLVGGLWIAPDTLIEVFLLTEDINDYDVSSISTWMNESTDDGHLHYWRNMPAEDKTIDISYVGTPASTYTVTVDGADMGGKTATVKMNGETVQYEQTYSNIADGTVVDVYPTGNVADYVLQSGAVWDTDHWTATVNGEDLEIYIDYLGVGVNFNASWSGAAPQNVSQINIGNTSVTGSDLTDNSWTETVRLYPGQSQIKYFISTGLVTNMEAFYVDINYQVDGHTEYEAHSAYKETDPVSGEITYVDAADNYGSPIANPGTWTYDNNPDSGLPWIAFTLPSTDKNGNAYADNSPMQIIAVLSSSDS